MALHPVHAHRQGIDQAEMLRVLGEHRREVAAKRHIVADEDAVLCAVTDYEKDMHESRIPGRSREHLLLIIESIDY